jgi:hypothetical protein
MAQLRLAALVSLALAAGCAGGGGTAHPVVPARAASAGNATIALSLLIPRAPSARARSVRYLSVATKSVVVTVTGGATQGFDVAPTSPNCTAGTNGTICTMSVIAPIINAFTTLSVTAYDQPRAANGTGQGNVLSDGSINIIVVEGSDNKVQLVLGGNVATLALNIPDPHPLYWVGRRIDGDVVAKDAAGYTIVGSYDAKIVLTSSSFPPGFIGGYPISSSYDRLNSLSFEGTPSPPITVTVTAANGATDSKVLTPVVQSGTVAVTAPNINIYVDVPYNRTLQFNVINTTTMYGLFATPRASAFDGAGNLYMTDNGPKSSSSPSGPAVWVFPAGYCYSCTGAPKPVILGAAAFGNDAPLVLATDSANTILYVGTANAIYGFALPLTASSTPVTTIAGTATGLANVTGLAAGANELGVSMSNGTVATFAKSANGNASPQRVIAGSATTLQSPQGLAFDATGNLWVTDAAANDVASFTPGANGNAPPMTSLAGSSTALNAPQGVAFDHTGAMYVVDHSGRTHIYAPGATGNAVQQSFVGGATAANGLAVFP